MSRKLKIIDCGATLESCKCYIKSGCPFAIQLQNSTFKKFKHSIVLEYLPVLACVGLKGGLVCCLVVFLHLGPLPEPLRAEPALELLATLVLVVVVTNQAVAHRTSVKEILNCK